MAKDNFQRNRQYSEGGRGQRPSEEEELRGEISEDFGDDWSKIINPTKPDYNAHIHNVKKFAERIERKVTTSQIRNVFSRVKSIKDVNGLYTLRPKLAYTAGKSEGNRSLRKLIILLDSLIVMVKTQEQLKEFQDFFEAIIAYHRYFGGKE